MSLPTTVELSSPTPTPMSVTVTNPATGADWSNDLLPAIQDSGPRPSTETPRSTTRTVPGTGARSLPTAYPGYNFSGFGTPPCGTEASSFSLAPGQSLTLNLQVSIAYDPTTIPVPAPECVNPVLYNGSCSSPTNCTESNSPFNSILPTSSGAPETSGTFTMTYGARSPVSFSNTEYSHDAGTRGVHDHLQALCEQPASNPYGTMPVPTGTLTYLVDGTVVGIESADSDVRVFLLHHSRIDPRYPHAHRRVLR